MPSRRTEYWATGLLIFMSLVFMLAKYLEIRYPGFAYLRAFSEAAMIGALADWFAVVALFGYPLGIPIPHTNLVKERQKDFADGLGVFIVENFLNDESIGVHLDKIKFSDEILEFVTKEQNPTKLARQITKYVPSMLANLDETEANQFIESNLRAVIENVDSTDVLSKMLTYLVENKMHQKLLADVIDLSDKYVRQDAAVKLIYDQIKERREWYWPPSLVIAERIADALRTELQEIRSQPEHEIRIKLNHFIEQFIFELQHSDDYKQAAETIKQSLLSNEQFLSYSQRIWTEVKGVVVKDAFSANSRLESSLRKALGFMTDKLQNDTQLQTLINQTLRREALSAIRDIRQDIAQNISQTVAGWSDISERIQNEVGNDLQFIRINGTLVGGSIGLLLYIVFDKLLPMLAN